MNEDAKISFHESSSEPYGPYGMLEARMGDKLYGEARRPDSIAGLVLSFIVFQLLFYFLILMYDDTSVRSLLPDMAFSDYLQIVSGTAVVTGLMILGGHYSAMRHKKPVLFERGILVPPDDFIGAMKNHWTAYTYNRVKGLCPQFTIQLEPDPRIEFHGFLIRFTEGREFEVRSEWGDFFSNTLLEQIKKHNPGARMKSSDYHSFHTLEEKAVDDLFSAGSHILAGRAGRIVFNMKIALLLIAAFVVLLFWEPMLSDRLGIEGICGSIVIILVTGMILLYIFVIRIEMEENQPRLMVLYHLIEYEMFSASGKIPKRYEEQVRNLNGLMSDVERTDRKIMDEFLERSREQKGVAVDPTFKYFSELGLVSESMAAGFKRKRPRVRSKYPVTTVIVDGKKVGYIESENQKSIVYLGYFTLAFCICNILLILLGSPFYQGQEFCCVAVMIIALVFAFVLPAFTPKRVGFSRDGFYYDIQGVLFGGVRTKNVQWADVLEVRVKGKSESWDSDEVVLRSDVKVSMAGWDDVFQEEIYSRFGEWKNNKKEKRLSKDAEEP